MDYKEVTNIEADSIIEFRKPLGAFWLMENNKYIAIDNTDGEAWVEEFYTKKECFDYLNE